MPHKDPEAAKRWRAKYRETERCKELRRLHHYKHRDEILERVRRHRLQKVYGITVEDYDRMFREQSGVCAICLRPPKNKRLCVDHDHKTGKVRGLLCNRCNGVLGKMADDAVALARAAQYLRPDFAGLVEDE